LLIEGSDLTAISQLAGRLTTLTVGRIGFSLSRQARERAQADVAAQAIGRFKAQADAYAKQFGFDSYSLREVEVSGGDEGGWRQPYQIAAARAPGSEAQPVEAGKEQVRVTVSGSVQLLPR
jgi:predicted secreted protein